MYIFNEKEAPTPTSERRHLRSTERAEIEFSLECQQAVDCFEILIYCKRLENLMGNVRCL